MYKYIFILTLTSFVSATNFGQEAKNFDSQVIPSEEIILENDTLKPRKTQILQEVIVITNQQKKPITARKIPVNTYRSLQTINFKHTKSPL